MKTITTIGDLDFKKIREDDFVEVIFDLPFEDGEIEHSNLGIYRGRKDNQFEVVESIFTGQDKSIGILVYQQEGERLRWRQTQTAMIKKGSPEFKRYYPKLKERGLR